LGSQARLSEVRRYALAVTDLESEAAIAELEAALGDTGRS
jgi:hypothetical protein